MQNAPASYLQVSQFEIDQCLRLSQSVYEPIRRHGEETYPHECCGVLLGTDEWRRARRHYGSAMRQHAHRFSSEPLSHRSTELVRIQREGRERGEDIFGFYHSHPDHPARWSQTDLAEAHWFGCSYVITSVEKGKAAMTNSFLLDGRRRQISTWERKRFR